MRLDMKDRVYHAFAGLQEDGAHQTLGMCKQWVERLATRDFADELVLLAMAFELKIRIVCVPSTPPEATTPWVISTYQDNGGHVPEDRNVYFGNNDVHYMRLSRLTA